MLGVLPQLATASPKYKYLSKTRGNGTTIWQQTHSQSIRIDLCSPSPGARYGTSAPRPWWEAGPQPLNRPLLRCCGRKAYATASKALINLIDYPHFAKLSHSQIDGTSISQLATFMGQRAGRAAAICLLKRPSVMLLLESTEDGQYPGQRFLKTQAPLTIKETLG